MLRNDGLTTCLADAVFIRNGYKYVSWWRVSVLKNCVVALAFNALHFSLNTTDRLSTKPPAQAVMSRADQNLVQPVQDLDIADSVQLFLNHRSWASVHDVNDLDRFPMHTPGSRPPMTRRINLT